MVKGYEFYNSDGCTCCGMQEHESHMNLGADYVLASDYAALEERAAILEAENENLEYAISEIGDTPEERVSLRQQIDWLEAELARLKADRLAIVNRWCDGLKREDAYNPDEPLGNAIDRCVRAVGALERLKKEFALLRDMHDFLVPELARVKAESLRIVKDGEECHPRNIRHSFRLLLTTTGYLGIQYSDEDLILLAGPDEERLGFCDIYDDTVVQPVRLVKWGMSDGNASVD
jgi:hypothetical protein